MTLHYTNKKTNEVYGYESFKVAKEYNDDYENLVEMTVDQFIDFRDNRQKGGLWTHQGWVIDPELLAEAEAQEGLAKKAELTDKYNSLKQEMVFEGLMGRDTSELKEAILLIETELKEFEDE